MERDGQTDRILVVRFGGIGDLILNTPVVRELRKARPNAEITLLIPERGRNIYEFCPYVNNLLVVEPAWEIRDNPLRSLLSARSFWRKQARQEFDIALSPRVGLAPYLAFIIYFSGAPIRIGYSERFIGDLDHRARFTSSNLHLDILLTEAIDRVDRTHESRNTLAVLQKLQITPSDSSLEIWLQECDRAFAAGHCQCIDAPPGRLLVGIGVGAAAPKRVWPVERLLLVAHWLSHAYDARIVLLGGPDDTEAASAIAAQIGKPIVNLAGSASLRQTAAVIEACSILLVHDTGLLHIGSAVGTPVVEISCHPKSGSPTHSNAPERFGPWQVPHRIVRPPRPRPPCTDGCEETGQAHCILAIEPEEVQQALSELIVEQYGRTPNL